MLCGDERDSLGDVLQRRRSSLGGKVDGTIRPRRVFKFSISATLLNHKGPITHEDDVPFPSGKSITPLSIATSSCNLLPPRPCLSLAATSSALTRSRSRLPTPTVHDFSLAEMPAASPSSPAAVRRRFRGGLPGPSGGGVRGAWCREEPRTEMRRLLCSWTVRAIGRP